jgi:hypothetical protein
MTTQDIIHEGAVEFHRIQAAQQHLRTWRQRAALGWRLQASRARLQARHYPEWSLHADWCEAQARSLEGTQH